MAVLLITYDLNNETKRPPIVRDIKECGSSWAKLSESSYAVETTATPKQVYSFLSRHVDADDQLYVITLARPHYGYGAPAVSQWLDEKLALQPALT